MHISKLIDSDDTSDIFNNDNYPGKIQKHLFSIKIENYKMLYNYLNNNESYNIEECDNDDNYNIEEENNDLVYDEKSFVNNSYVVDDHIDNKESDKSSYFSDYVSDIKIINDSSNKDKNDIVEIKYVNDKIENNNIIKDLSKSEIIKKQDEEIVELKKIAKAVKKSENLNIFIEKLNMYGNEIINKKHVIINFAKTINLQLNLIDLQNLDIKDINDMYNIIENIKIKKNSYNFSNTLIRLIFVLIEKILVDILKLNVFRNISNDITDDFIELKCKSTKNFINKNTLIPEYPFIDIIIQICNTTIGKYVNISSILK
ncbi:viral membrane formation (Cop-A11R) [Adoxophyes honmai entomopoxvirus 'L']|uniref:Viral membrane formation (Cop-A11R) n=1 Tax=Adoxophyes honmai entomopoxvirus 'L' TaxID=1293540 RepID=A0A916KP82_9POXV|nr:viral membrane formation (Cop-A11R) [Adoxophyes honmai entomopoxvirus 'L']CCU55509.1 viral membrane formation (Cop-A11R) [Adoxophyes honmai entomopoxvirus 'L']